MNTTTPEQIDIWLSAVTENQRLEFKEAATQIDTNTLCEYCVALANEGGGIMLLGVTDKNPRKVVGSRAISDPVGMTMKLFDTLGFRVDVEVVAHPDGRVVVVHIPSRPRGTAYHLNGKYLMRSGEARIPISEDQLRGIFAEGAPDWLEECSRTKLTSQQVIEFLDTQTFFELLNISYPSTQQGVIDRLLEGKLIDFDTEYSVRRIGALLLARRLSDFPDVERKAPRVVVYNGTSKINTKLDQPGTKGYAVGFQGLVGFIMSQLPQNEIIQDAIRKEVKLIPEIAIRELVANAIIHQLCIA
jgi:predicted HTH transcriptional regulator